MNRTISISLAGMAFAAWFLSPTGLAEEGQPPAPPAVAPAPATNPETSIKSTIQTPALDMLLNPKGPPSSTGGPATVGELPGLSVGEQEALKEKIKSLNSLTSAGFDNPVVRARFEKYLNEPAADPKDAVRYLALIRKIEDALEKRDDRSAWKMLQELSDFEWDAEIGRALAARVEATWDMKLTNAQLEEKIRRLQQEVKSANWNADQMSRPSNLQSGEAPRSVSANRAAPKGGGGTVAGVTPDNVPFTEGKMRAISEYLGVVEGRAKIKATELKGEAVELKNKMDFQEYVGTLFTSRRHLHVILAADFYRCLYGGGDYPPTMAAQVNVSKEAVRDVERAIKVVTFKIEKKELAGAAEHLQNAFAASEFHTALLTLPLETKQKLQGLGFQVVKLQTMLEARDFGNVDALIKELQKASADFDTTKARSIVDAVKLESRLRLGNAKLAAQQGDLKTAMAEFRAAAQSWPGNPDLDMAQLGFFHSQDTKNQFLQEFDRLFEAKNYRAIFDQQLQLATAIVGDKERIERMKVAMEKVKVVETAIEKANLLCRNNNPYGAWEALQTAIGEWADDPKLNKLRAELSAESADFVKHLKRGEEAEKMGSYGYSLACFLNAQRLYPASEVAREAVSRLSAKILKKKPAVPTDS
ncbi:MAG: hypothetical protein HY360_00710 [Verrucomicrobia bacterium]|nr:hypothetical protein [Verrucomicrobiota bacterium]